MPEIPGRSFKGRGTDRRRGGTAGGTVGERERGRERNVEDGEKGTVGEKKVRKEVWDKKEEERKCYERRNDK